jgi:VanZ family protein
VKIEKKLAIAWTVCIIIGSLLPSAFVKIQMLDSITGSDKYLHITVYAIAACIWLISSGKVRTEERVVLLSGLCLMGFFLEILQITINTGRFFEWYDALANCIGVFAGFLIYNFFLKSIY